MTVEEASPPPVGIWIDNLATVNTFIAMSTQWRIGPVGATGLDYGPLQSIMRTIGVPLKERADVFDGLRIMEDTALEVMAAARKKK